MCVATRPHDIDLDGMTSEELEELLNEVMVKLRHRDAQDIQKNLARESQRLTLPENIARHLKQTKES